MEEDKFKQFEGEGVVFKAKLIGSELVMEPRGETMCQNSIQRLKAIIKGQKAHKKRIVLKISYAGVKVLDEKTNELLYEHEVPQISFISSDDTDTRTFGYVCDVPNKAHQFICLKTSGPAVQVMSVISSLFEAVLEKKKKEEGAGAGENKGEEKDKGEGGGDRHGASGLAASKGNNDNPDGAINRNSSSKIFDDFDDDKLSQLNINEKTSTPEAATGLPLATSEKAQQQRILRTPPGRTAEPTRQTSLQQTLSFSSPIDLIDGSDSGIIDSLSTTFSGDGWLPAPPPPTSTSTSAPQQQQQQPQPQQQPPQAQYQPQPSDAPLRQKRPNQIPIERQASSFDQSFASSSLSAGRPPMVPNFGQQQRQQSDSHGQHNRSLIYNHSSVSLNEAALSTGRSFQSVHESTDKYAVFNDIDNLPSIFESTSSLGSKTNLSGVGQSAAGVAAATSTPSAAGPAASNTFDHFSGLGPQLSGRPFPARSHLTAGHSFDSSSLAQNNNNNNNYYNHNHNHNHNSSGLSQGQPGGQQDQLFAQAPPVSSASPFGQQQHQHQHQQQQQQQQQQQFQQPQVQLHVMNRAAPTPSMTVPKNLASGAFGAGGGASYGQSGAGMIVGSAPMGSHQMNAHARFSSSMVAGLHQRLGSSAASINSAGSASAISRQMNPFDDDFFS